MSHLNSGFVSDSRFGDGPVIKRTNRSVTRAWRNGGELSHHVCYRCGVSWDAHGNDASGVCVRLCFDCKEKEGSTGLTAPSFIASVEPVEIISVTEVA